MYAVDQVQSDDDLPIAVELHRARLPILDDEEWPIPIIFEEFFAESRSA